jgi:hypothetical protein
MRTAPAVAAPPARPGLTRTGPVGLMLIGQAQAGPVQTGQGQPVRLQIGPVPAAGPRSAAKADCRAPLPPAAESPAQGAHGPAASPASRLAARTAQDRVQEQAPVQGLRRALSTRVQDRVTGRLLAPNAVLIPARARRVLTLRARKAHPIPAPFPTPGSLRGRAASAAPILAGNPRPATGAQESRPLADVPSRVASPSPATRASLPAPAQDPAASVPAAHRAERSAGKYRFAGTGERG